jgi:N-acetylneuraminic acid mutarotase
MSGRLTVRTKGRRGGILVLLATAIVGFAACGGANSTSTASNAPPTASEPSTSSMSASGNPFPTPASWRRIATSPVHGDYYLPAAAVWDGAEMLVVVTQSDPKSYCKETLFAYDPSNDSWRTVSQVPTPKGCFEGSDQAVWTGHELLLWGISNAAYDPASDTWRKLPRPPAGAGGPSVVVWTGTQMIGWGGGCCDEQLADGAAYTPATNSWRMLPPSPLAGRHASGAWTGTEMIIAGGQGGYDPKTGHAVAFADVAAYDPTVRTWRKLPPMPVGRAGDYDAVWDGSEMLVVGGVTAGSTVPLARGVAYDPARNDWRWLAPMAYPRSGFVSGWVGDQLVVWGGLSGSYRASTIPPNGETFDPRSNQWSSLPQAPSRARVSLVGVWTGTEFVIWGGDDARDMAKQMSKSTALYDGAALTPPSD